MSGPYTSYRYGPRLANPDGTVNVRCRQCGRVIARVHGPMITTVSQCQICVLVAQGVARDAAEELVLPRYYQENLTKPPQPIKTPEEETIALYPEEIQANKKKGWGALRPLFKVLGWWGEEKPKEQKVSTTVARRKRRVSLLEDEEEVPEE